MTDRRARATKADIRRAHGLRKAGATIAAEAGASAHQLMAMFGWTKLEEAERYTRGADRKRSAAADEIERLRKVLLQIAATTDEQAEKHLQETGSYSRFDEPNAVQIARKAIRNAP